MAIVQCCHLRFMMGQYVTLHGEVISDVNISRTIVEDGGLYTCEATNRAGSSIHSARLNVYGELRDVLAKYYWEIIGAVKGSVSKLVGCSS